jgi:hypothetical protein
MTEEWWHSFPAEIIVCDEEGIILGMSDTAVEFYKNDGGAALIGRNVFDHHNEPERSQVQAIVARRKTTIYTTSKGGHKKLVCIAPWLSNGSYAGFSLLVIDLPDRISNIDKG